MKFVKKHIMRIFLFTIFTLFSFSSLSKGYKINGEVKGLSDTTILLAYYFGGNQYAKDTAYSVNGKFTFEGEKELLEGMYLIVLPEQKYFDIILTEQNFNFTTNLNDIVESMTFKNSVENPLFYQYLKFITTKQREVSQLKNQLASEKSESQKLVFEKNIEIIDKEVLSFRDKFVEKNSNLFFTKIIKSTIEISIPESPLDSTGNPDKNFPFRFYKKNFWNNIDLTDERMLRTPVFHNKMTQYLDKLTVKNPDSIIESADLFISKIKNNDIFKYVVSHITSTYERSKIMGMDAVFVHMVENYYMQDKCDWVDEKQLKKIVERAEKIAPNLIGRVAPEFVDIIGRPFMKDPNGKIYKLSDVKSDYTILVFYAPDCGHCKKEIPRIKEVTDSLNLNGIDIKVFAVTTEFDKEEWIKFIKEKNTENWINVGDIQKDEEGNPMASSDWRDKYDIYSTPVVYLLDSNKKILAKRISYEQIVEIIALKEK